MRSVRLALAAATLALGCGNESSGAPSIGQGGTTSIDCAGRGDMLSAGQLTTSSGGYTFEILELDPDPPILSQSEPGNTWKLGISDPAGQPVGGASIVVHTYMPVHGHPGPSAVGVELEQEPGKYLIEDLLLPMPALYSITLSANIPGGSVEDVSYSICVSAQTG